MAAPETYAQTAGSPLMCVSNAGVPPVVRAEGHTEVAGDIVVSCTGGNPAQQFSANFQIFLNTNITSRLITATQSEALLMIDEPGATRAAGRPTGFCVASPGNHSAPTSDPACIAQPADTFQSGFNTVFYAEPVQEGSGTRANSLVWSNVPVVPPGNNRTRTFRFTNLRVNAAGLGASETLIPTQIVAFLAVSPLGTLPIDNPQQTVGYIQRGVSFDVRNAANTESLNIGVDQCTSDAANRDFRNDPLRSGDLPARGMFRFREGFQTAFKPQIGAGQNGADVGSVYNSESGFVRQNGSSVNGTGIAGLADSGTRLAVRFANVPANLRIFVSTTDLGAGAGTSEWPAQPGSSLEFARAVIVSTNSNGASTPDAPVIRTPDPPQSDGYLAGSVSSFMPQVIEVPIQNGSGIAVWEVIRSNPSVSEEFLFGFGLGYTHQSGSTQVGLGTATVTGSLAPFYASGSVPEQMSALLPAPRFVSPTETINAIRVQACPAGLTWTTPPPATVLVGSQFSVLASLPVTYSAGPASVCAVSGSLVTTIARGTCTVRAALVGAPNSALEVPVNVMAGLTCSYSLSAPGQQIAAGPGTGSFTVNARTGCSWTAVSGAPWITITAGAPGRSSAPVTFSVAANPTTTPRTGTIMVSGLTFTITQAAGAEPTPIALSRTNVPFGAVAGNAALTTGPQQVHLTGATGKTWTAVSNQAWLTVMPASGTGNATLTLALNTAGLPAAGTHTATVTITASATTSPATITVPLTIRTAAAAIPPIGVVDTPAADGVVRSGAIGVTGWAVDETEVSRVSIWRNPLPGEPTHANGHVFIGDAVFLEGARPDVAAQYPTYPRNTRAGWGLQVLTNMLPNSNGQPGRGNGNYTFYVYAHDRDGNVRLIGSPVVSVNNAAGVKPFGTVDRPTNGEEIFGMFTVWGWALTPAPASIPTDGSTIWVFVDGVPVGHPVYNLERADIVRLFPGYSNTAGAVGYYQLDTTQLTDGLHRIAWSVTDNLGRTEGIGSRVFSVRNAGATASDAAEQPTLRKSAARRSSRTDDGIVYRTGWDPDAALRPLESPEIRIEQGGRIELQVGRGVTGVLFNGSAILPEGSTFDAERGVFYWHLDVAYIESYELAFDSFGAEPRRVRVRVVTNPE